MSTAVDWTIIENDIVDAVIHTEAKRVGHAYSGVIEEADLRQEAYIVCATNAEIVRGYVTMGDVGYLSKWLWSRLTDIARSMANTSNREVAFEWADA